MKQAVIYTRVSSKEQVDNYSLSAQLTACTAYCERTSFKVARVFVEEGESAKSADRTELQKLLAFCEEARGQVQAVVVHNLSRFARDRFDHHALLAHLRRLGIVLRSATEPVDESPSGELMDAVLAAMHQFENRLRAERTQSGMLSALGEGRWVWKAPLGYLQGTNGLLEPDPATAPLIRWAFERLAGGDYGQEEVRRQVHERGLRSATGKRIGRQTWHQMMRNPLYGGRVVHDGWGIDTEAAFAPIVPRETFLLAQEALEGRRREEGPGKVSRKLDHPDFPLRRFVRCAACGTPLTGGWSRGNGGRYAYYRCRNTECERVRLRVESLEEQFVELLRRLQPTKEYLRLLRKEVLAAQDRRRHAARQQREAAERRLKIVRERKDRLVAAYLYEQDIDQETYRREMAKLSKQLRAAEVTSYEAAIEDMDVDGIFHFAETVLTDAARLWLEMAPEAKRRFQRHVFPEGVELCPERGF